jgi:hypothetical protein
VDLRVFYQKIRNLEKELDGDYVVLVSNETGDGGRSGQTVEVAKPLAARMIVEGRARLASAEECKARQKALERAVEAVRRRELVEKAHVRLLSDADIDALRAPVKPSKS